MGIAYRKLLRARRPPFAPQLYVTLTRLNAKQILWSDLLRLNEEHGLGGEPNHSELILRMPQGADIVLAGANNEREIAKIRGKRFKGATIDEPQSMADRILKPLINDAISPALLDFDGYLALAGTPGAVRAGHFYDVCHGTSGRWERHRWTLRDNPHLERLSGKPIDQLLAEVRAEHGWTEEDPTYLREYRGEWVDDVNALVFRYSADRNGFDQLPEGRWSYVIGVDLGYEDSDAIAVLGWCNASPDVFLVEEMVCDKLTISELGDRLNEMVSRRRPQKVVVDAGGLGRKIVEELRRRWGIPCEAAEKQRKAEHIELLNDGLRTGRLRAKRDSRFAGDAAVVVWDQDDRARGVHKIADQPHSDIADAVLYAYRACHHYLWRPPAPEVPDRGEQIRQAILRDSRRRERQDEIGQLSDLLGFGERTSGRW